MPAHPDRQQVLLRLYPSDAKKLDAIVTEQGGNRTALLLQLIQQAYDALPARKRRQLEKETTTED